MSVLHISTEVKIHLGIHNGENVSPVEPLVFTLSRVDEESLGELLGLIRARWQELEQRLLGEPATGDGEQTEESEQTTA